MEKKNQILKKNANSNGSLISMEWNGMALFSPLPYQNKVFAANIATTVLFQKIGILYFNYI